MKQLVLAGAGHAHHLAQQALYHGSGGVFAVDRHLPPAYVQRDARRTLQILHRLSADRTQNELQRHLIFEA